MARSRSALSAENQTQPGRRFHAMDDAELSRLFNWRDALVAVRAETLIRRHRKGFRRFWRWKSKPAGRPRLPKHLQELIRRMSAKNPNWRQERIANELMLKLGIQVSPRTVQKYLNTPQEEPPATFNVESFS